MDVRKRWLMIKAAMTAGYHARWRNKHHNWRSANSGISMKINNIPYDGIQPINNMACINHHQELLSVMA